VYGIHFALPKSTYTNATLPIMAELLDLYDEVENTGPPNALVGETIKLDPSYSIDLAKLFPADTSYFRWNGSLTGPPCTEGACVGLLATIGAHDDAPRPGVDHVQGAPADRRA
jgi:hypothetical protein